MAKRRELLNTRVTEVYELFKIPSWRKAEAYMTDESKDIFYEQPKGPILEFTIKSLDLEPDGTSAMAGVEIKFSMPKFPAPFVLLQKTRWLYEKENWFMKLEPRPKHPLGAFLDNQPTVVYKDALLRFSKFEQDVTSGTRDYVFTFQSAGKEPLQAQAFIEDCHVCQSAQFDKPRYAPGESGQLRVRAFADPKVRPLDYPVRVFIMPDKQWIVLKLRHKGQ